MRSSLLMLLIAAVFSTGFAPVPPPKQRKPKDGELSLKALEGTWTVVSYEIGRAQPKGGRVAAVAIRPLTTITYQTVEIKGGKWTQKRTLPNGQTSQTVGYPIILDASKAPATFDLSTPRPTLVNGKAAANFSSPTRLGLARLDGDRLTVVYSLAGQERPSQIDGDLPARQYRWVLKRGPR